MHVSRTTGPCIIQVLKAYDYNYKFDLLLNVLTNAQVAIVSWNGFGLNKIIYLYP